MIQIHTDKYIEHVPSKPTTASMRKKGIDKYANAQTTMCIHTTTTSTSIALVRVFVLDYKSQPCAKLRVKKTVVV